MSQKGHYYAFPNDYMSPACQGLTKREYFAAQALTGLMRAFSTNTLEAARLAVKQADALLKELEKSNE